MMPGTMELLISASVPLVGLLLIIAAIFRLRKKLSESEKPTFGTYINELGGYAVVGLILFVGGLGYVATQLMGSGDSNPHEHKPDQQPAVDAVDDTPIRAGGHSEQI